MEPTEPFLINAAAVAVWMLLLWLVSLPLRDVSIVDIAWGLGFVLVAWLTFAISGPVTSRSLALAICATLWGVRLSGYLAWRNLGHPEDFRYQSMRKRYGSRFSLISLFIVFGLQGVVMWIVSLPLQTGQTTGQADDFGATAVIGIGVWAAGLLFESIGDFQLARFKADPMNEGQVMDRGLWRYTRHPNYFGDFLVWWGLYLVSFGDGGMWWSVIGPVVMSICLMKISGVTLLEKSLKKRRSGYDEYIERTSAFFPRPPKRSA
jgi:steroid 5-alpha reductase family enzyme